MISYWTKLEESYPNRKNNTVGKGKIARYKQLLLFPQCFQKACFPGVSKGVIVWEWVKHVLQDWVENQWGKRENAGYQHFFLYLTIFLKAIFNRIAQLIIVWKKLPYYQMLKSYSCCN